MGITYGRLRFNYLVTKIYVCSCKIDVIIILNFEIVESLLPGSEPATSAAAD